MYSPEAVSQAAAADQRKTYYRRTYLHRRHRRLGSDCDPQQGPRVRQRSSLVHDRQLRAFFFAALDLRAGLEKLAPSKSVEVSSSSAPLWSNTHCCIRNDCESEEPTVPDRVADKMLSTDAPLFWRLRAAAAEPSDALSFMSMFFASLGQSSFRNSGSLSSSMDVLSSAPRVACSYFFVCDGTQGGIHQLVQ